MDETPKTEDEQVKEAPKQQFTINLFQTARVLTEQVTQEFENEEAARKYAEELCEDKGIKADFEVVRMNTEQTDETITDRGVDAAPATEE